MVFKLILGFFTAAILLINVNGQTPNDTVHFGKKDSIEVNSGSFLWVMTFQCRNEKNGSSSSRTISNGRNQNKIPDSIFEEAETKHIFSDVALIEIKLDSNCIIKSVDIIKLGKLESFNQHVSKLCKEFEQYIFENKLERFYSCGEMKCSDWNNLKMPIKLYFK